MDPALLARAGAVAPGVSLLFVVAARLLRRSRRRKVLRAPKPKATASSPAAADAATGIPDAVDADAAPSSRVRRNVSISPAVDQAEKDRGPKRITYGQLLRRVMHEAQKNEKLKKQLAGRAQQLGNTAGGDAMVAGGSGEIQADGADGAGPDSRRSGSERDAPSTSASGRAIGQLSMQDLLQHKELFASENGALMQQLAKQVDEIRTHNAELMAAFRRSEAKLTALEEENAQLRSEVASIRGVGNSTPTNGSELGQFKAAHGSQQHRAPSSRGGGMSMSDMDSIWSGVVRGDGGAGSFGALSPYSWRSPERKLGNSGGRKDVGGGGASAFTTPASSAVMPLPDNLLTLLEGFGGR